VSPSGRPDPSEYRLGRLPESIAPFRSGDRPDRSKGGRGLDKPTYPRIKRPAILFHEAYHGIGPRHGDCTASPWFSNDVRIVYFRLVPSEDSEQNCDLEPAAAP